jgi:hypothetical protein
MNVYNMVPEEYAIVVVAVAVVLFVFLLAPLQATQAS